MSINMPTSSCHMIALLSAYVICFVRAWNETNEVLCSVLSIPTNQLCNLVKVTCSPSISCYAKSEH